MRALDPFCCVSDKLNQISNSKKINSVTEEAIERLAYLIFAEQAVCGQKTLDVYKFSKDLAKRKIQWEQNFKSELPEFLEKELRSFILKMEGEGKLKAYIRNSGSEELYTGSFHKVKFGKSLDVTMSEFGEVELTDKGTVAYRIPFSRLTHHQFSTKVLDVLEEMSPEDKKYLCLPMEELSYPTILNHGIVQKECSVYPKAIGNVDQLDSLIKEGRLQEKDRLVLARDVFRILGVLAKYGLLHGDIKSENILIMRKESSVHLALSDLDGLNISEKKYGEFTPNNLSPCAFFGVKFGTTSTKANLSFSNDLYAFSIVLSQISCPGFDVSSLSVMCDKSPMSPMKEFVEPLSSIYRRNTVALEGSKAEVKQILDRSWREEQTLNEEVKDLILEMAFHSIDVHPKIRKNMSSKEARESILACLDNWKSKLEDIFSYA